MQMAWFEARSNVWGGATLPPGAPPQKKRMNFSLGPVWVPVYYCVLYACVGL